MMRRVIFGTVLAAVAVAIGAPTAMAATTVSGKAIYDVEFDGILDSEDTPIEGLRLFFDFDNDGGLDPTELVATTGPDGIYSFPGLGAGTRTFRVAPNAAQPSSLRGLICVNSCAITRTLDGTTNSTGNDFYLHFDGDVDGDRFVEPDDCDDTDAKINPGALEIRGDPVDENCDGVALPFPEIDAAFSVSRKGTLVRQLDVTDDAEDASAEVTCDGNGCPFAKYTMFLPSGTPVRAAPLFEKRKLKAGTVITVTISAPQTIGRVATYTTRKNKKPKETLLCQEPGAPDTIPCP